MVWNRNHNPIRVSDTYTHCSYCGEGECILDRMVGGMDRVFCSVRSAHVDRLIAELAEEPTCPT